MFIDIHNHVWYNYDIVIAIARTKVPLITARTWTWFRPPPKLLPLEITVSKVEGEK